MANFDLEQLRDKILGCWAGKNVGGTLGGPFEGKLGPHNVTYYTQQLGGQPLPNDDLDLQLIWLAGIEKYYTPYELTPRIMGFVARFHHRTLERIRNLSKQYQSRFLSSAFRSDQQ